MSNGNKSPDHSSSRISAGPLRPRSNARNMQPGWIEPEDVLCDHGQRYPPKRRPKVTSTKLQRHATGQTWRAWSSLTFVLFMGILLYGQAAEAAQLREAGVLLEQGTELLYDRSDPPPPPMQLHQRQMTTSNLSSSVAAPTSNSSATGPATLTTSSIATAASTSQISLPTPFDSSLGNNFTASSCPAFFQHFLSNSTFQQCHPFSLLLQTSNGFFTASHSPVALTQTLDATCNVNFPLCASLMASFAQQIQLPSTCGTDLQMQNPVVEQAYNGLIAYPTLYHAGCLTDPQGNYCFANAVTNASAPTSSYIYYLPLGLQLPAGTLPACNQCLQNTMSLFATSAGNSSQPLSTDYAAAAAQIDISCGPTFVAASAQPKSGANFLTPNSGVGWGLLVFVILSAFVA